VGDLCDQKGILLWGAYANHSEDISSKLSIMTLGSLFVLSMDSTKAEVEERGHIFFIFRTPI